MATYLRNRTVQAEDSLKQHAYSGRLLTNALVMVMQQQKLNRVSKKDAFFKKKKMRLSSRTILRHTRIGTQITFSIQDPACAIFLSNHF